MEQHPDLADLIQAHATRVRRVLARRGVRAADLADVEQEVFIIAHQKLGALEVRSSLLGWLVGIASRLASQYRRRASYRRERLGLMIEPACDALDPLAHLQAHERSARLQRWLGALSPEQRDVIVLHELSELSMHEVAGELGIPLKTAFSRLYAAHRALRRTVLRERLTHRRRGIGAALAGLLLGFTRLSRAHAALLPAPIAALIALGVATGAAPALSLTSASTERYAAEVSPLGGLVATKLAPAREPAVSGPPARRSAVRAVRRAPDALEHASVAPPSLEAELVVLRVDGDYATAPLPYPHPFEERAFTSVDPRTVKPRVIMPEPAACDPGRGPCAL